MTFDAESEKPKEINLQRDLLEGLPETDIEITQGDIRLLAEKKGSENPDLNDYIDRLSEEDKEMFFLRIERLYRKVE